jgi:hypothetical protein
MMLSQYMRELSVLLAEHGDLEVNTLRFNGERMLAPRPKLAYKRILEKREWKEDFWHDDGSEHDIEHRGEKVVRI